MAPQQQHALDLPFPLQGHINPLLQLSHHLASSHGFLVTFVNTEHNHIKPASNGCGTPIRSSINMVGLPDGLPAEAERKASDMSQVVVSMDTHMRPLLEQLIADIYQSGRPITCIIADIFMHWVPQVAKKAHIPALVGFHASSIAQFSFLYHIPLLLSSGQVHTDGTTKGGAGKFTGIPGVVDIPHSCAPWLVGDAKRDEHTFKGLAAVSALVEEFDVLLFNSFTELEKEAVEGLVKGRVGAAKEVKMLPIGPCLLLDDGGSCRDEDIDVANIPCNTGINDVDTGCMEWLQGRPRNSVLYIAFGTTAWLTREQLHELALGVEASRVSFLWVLRTDLLADHAGSGEANPSTLPHGFLERTLEFGYFTSWAPQTAVLCHPAVGAFLTHGGWNSTLEAISMGVPTLVLSDFWDQKFHAEQVVEQWKVGLPLKKRSGQGTGSVVAVEATVGRGEVERLVRCVMEVGVHDILEGAQMRGRACALSSKAKLAMANPSGSSYRNLQELIQFVRSKNQ